MSLVAAIGPEASSVASQIGYRWQLPDNHFVFGLEAQGDWANLSASRVSVLDPDFTFHSKVDGLGLFTAQLGFAWDMWLWYVKAGAAVTSSNFTISSTATGADLVSANSTRWGGVVGTGFEYAFTPNWSVGFEYDHLFLGGSDLACGSNIAACANINVLSRFSQAVDLFTVRFNYRFGGFAGPVVARY
jgi:outer membrane immunogenic protein